jgi:uncharacterized membrane protein
VAFAKTKQYTSRYPLLSIVLQMPTQKKDLPEISSTEGADKPPFISNSGLVLTVYILYLLGFITGISSIIGVIIASLQKNRSDSILRTHNEFQIRTFWIGLLFAFVGFLTAHLGIGVAILLWWFIWTLIRCVKGLLALNEGKPIPDPNSWLFGD